MVEKFSDFEGSKWLAKEGSFVFEVKEYELTESSSGNNMAVLTVECSEGKSIIRHSLNPKARWSYNALIAACLNLDTEEKRKKFTLDYETIGNDLIGCKFVGKVEKSYYEKPTSVLNEDGTMSRGTEEKESYKIVSYDFCK